uniref:EF-hand domain-containing protein n=1 Tax=Haptolina brevifila TaxID=156173 RepID=A0A7S2HGJ3_9EUKA
MRPVRRNAIKREKALVLASEERLNSALNEIRTSLLRELPKVVNLFYAFDRNGDGMISKGEFCQVLPLLKLPAHGMAEMQALFEAIDEDNNGAIEYSELNRLLRKGADMQLAPELQAGARGPIEVSAKGRFTVRRHVHDGPRSPQKEATVEQIKQAMVKQASRVVDFYHMCDVDGDGKVSRAEFRSALPLLGFGAGGQRAIDELFDTLDTSGNDSIEYTELAAVLRRDDVEIAPELQPGALGVIDPQPRNAIPLRRDAREGVGVPQLPGPSLSSMRSTLAANMAKVGEMMAMLDVNADGRVSRTEFRTALPLLGLEVSGSKVADQLFDSLDLNQDGELELNELKEQLMAPPAKGRHRSKEIVATSNIATSP